MLKISKNFDRIFGDGKKGQVLSIGALPSRWFWDEVCEAGFDIGLKG